MKCKSSQNKIRVWNKKYAKLKISVIIFIQRQVRAKSVFLQSQLLCNIDSIIQSLYFFFWQCNHYLLNKRKNSCFLRIATKAPSGFNKIYKQYLNGYDESIYRISYFPNKCFVRKWRLKFQVPKYCLKWNIENMTRSIITPKKITQNAFKTTLTLEID